MRKIFYLAMLFAMPAMAQQTTVSTFEDTDAEFNEKGFWNGGPIGEPEEGDYEELNYYCTAGSGLLTANLTYSYMEYAPGYGYDWWGGVALSKRESTEFVVLDDQYNNVVGTGAGGSKTFGVIYGSGSTIDVNVEGGALINSIWVVNSTYTHNNFTKNTGSYDTKFTKDGDHFYLNIVATRADGTEKTAVVKLAEWNDSLQYIDQWTRIGLDSLGTDVTRLTFNFDCNKPMVATYACIDDIEVVTGVEGVATFENLQLDEESFWNGMDDTGAFISGAFKFENGHEVQDYGEWGIFDYCYGFFYTNRTANTYTGNASTEQYNSVVGGGADGSAYFATYNLNSYNMKGVDVLGAEQIIDGCYITNNAYAYTSMTKGDSYARKFGQGDWFKLTITGIDAEGNTTGTVDFYLADMRSEVAEQQYILDEWSWCDLSTLGAVKRLEFAMSSSDNGDFGMNTPAYFCIDNLGAQKPTTDGISTAATKTAGAVTRYDLGGRQMQQAARGLNIVRMADGTVRKVMVK